jgi:hypothetical protein
MIYKTKAKNKVNYNNEFLLQIETVGKIVFIENKIVKQHAQINYTKTQKKIAIFSNFSHINKSV